MQQMTTAEKLAMVKSMMGITDTSEDTVITNYLTCAEREILTWRYSYGTIPESVPVEYEMTQIHAVLAGYNLRGAENQTSHSENGITRSFSYTDMVRYIRNNVIPLCKVL
jgi:Phage QLRG family, putative DNA packaging.